MDWFVYIYFQLVDRLLHIHYQPNLNIRTIHHWKHLLHKNSLHRSILGLNPGSADQTIYERLWL